MQLYSLILLCSEFIFHFVFQEPEDEVFLAIAKAMEEMVEDPIECYWLVSCFVNQLNSKHKDSLQQLVRIKYSFCVCVCVYEREREEN